MLESHFYFVFQGSTTTVGAGGGRGRTGQRNRVEETKNDPEQTIYREINLSKRSSHAAEGKKTSKDQLKRKPTYLIFST